MNRQRSIALLVVILLVAIIGWTVLTPVRIWYLKHALELTNERLHAAMAAERSGASLDIGSTELSEQGRRLCDRLVAVGYFFHQSYEMDNLPDSDAVYDAMMDRWMREFPNSPYSTMSARDYVFDVYDLRESKPQWDAFVQKYNVVDFVDRFASGPTADAEPTNAAEP